MNIFRKRAFFFLLLGAAFLWIPVYAESQAIKSDLKSFVVELKHKAEQGNAEAQYHLGRLYDPRLYTYLSVLYNREMFYDMNASIVEEDRGYGTVETDYEEALNWYLKAADQGHIEAQKIIGIIYLGYEYGRGYDKAEKWLRKAVKQGDVEAQYYLGRVLCGDCYGYTREGDFAPSNELNDKEALKWFKLAANKGHADAQFRVAAMLFYGRQGVAKNDKEAAKWAHKAVERNVMDAKILLGHMYHEGRGVKQDYSKAAELYSEAIKQKGGICYYNCKFYDSNYLLFTEALIRLGNMYYSGQGVKQDYIEAYRFYFTSGFPEADLEGFDPEWKEFKIALENHPVVIAYFNEEFLEWPRKAAEQGYAEAQFIYGGHLFINCTIPEQNDLSRSKCQEAVSWYHKSAEQGNSEAQMFLGNLYNYPGGEVEAAKWYALAAKGGYIAAWIELKRLAIMDKIPEAQFALGQLFSEGCCYGVKKNEQNALKLFQMAGRQGYGPAIEAIENMKEGKQ